MDDFLKNSLTFSHQLLFPKVQQTPVVKGYKWEINTKDTNGIDKTTYLDKTGKVFVPSLSSSVTPKKT
jgi:hypothetical protein